MDIFHGSATSAENHGFLQFSNIGQQRYTFQVTWGYLKGRDIKLRQKIGTGEVKGSRKHGDPYFFGIVHQFSIFIPAEFQCFSVFTIGETKAVFVVVRLIICCLGIKLTIISLLQFDRVSAAILGNPKHLFGCFEISLVVVSHFGNNVTIAIICDSFSIYYQFSHRYSSFANLIPN